MAETRELRQAVELSINKIGHAMHDLDPAWHAFAWQERVGALAHALLTDPVLVQSMYIFKQPTIGGKVRARGEGEGDGSAGLAGCVAMRCASAC